MKKLYTLFLVLAIPATLFSQSVFINEIHYDNSGTDASEGIEIAGPAGTDLTGWALQPYNGNGGTLYSTTALSGTIPDQGNGFGTLWFPILGLQNGAPDGVALVDNTSAVIQFLSYEGSFTAVGGPADGLTSVDIGVAQIGTAVDITMQLQGTGYDYTSFSWVTGIGQTRGLVNTGQTLIMEFVPPVWAASYPTMTNTSAYGVDLTVNLNETGMVYFMVILDGETAPSSAEVKAGVDYADVTPTYPDNFNYLVADADQLFPLWGATPATAYDIYVVAEDASENLQSVPVKFDVATTSLGIMITSPQPGETYNTGQTIDFTWNSVGVTDIVIGGYNFTQMDYFIITEDGFGNPDPVDASLGTYSFTIPNDAPFDSLAIIMWDASNMAVRDSVAPIYMADALPPVIDELYPLNNAVNVAASYTPEIYFVEPVFTGTGKIYIKDESGTPFEDFDIAGAGAGQALEFVWDNYGIRINPSSDFLAGTKYYVEMDAGVVKDYFNNDFGGISGSTTWAFTIAGTMAVDNEIESAIKIYPVPVSAELTISNLADLRYVEIMDLTGSKVFSSKQIDSGEYKIDVSTLPKGIYFIKLETSTNLYTRKFIKQ